MTKRKIWLFFCLITTLVGALSLARCGSGIGASNSNVTSSMNAMKF